MAIDAQGNYIPEPIQQTEAIPTLNVDPSAVYSASNIAQASTAPVAPPNLSDPMGLYDYYLNSGDIQGAQSSLKTINEQYNKALATGRAQQTAIENIPRESMSFIGTAQQRAGTLANQQLQGISEAKMAQQSYIDTLQSRARDKFNIANQQRSQLQDLIAQTGGRAGISYADTYEQAVKKADKYQEKKTKEEAEKAKKDAYKQSLKDTYTQLKGYAPKPMSTSELEKKVRKLSKTALAEAKKTSELKASELKASAGGASGGYTSQEERKLRAEGIDPSDIAAADKFLYQGISPRQESESKLTDSLASTVQSLMSQNVPMDKIRSAIEQHGYSVEDVADAYGIDISGYKPGGTFGTISGSGVGFWGNLWSGTKNLFK